MNITYLTHCGVTNKKVFVRADLNIPLSKAGTPREAHRLKSIVPTLTYLLDHGAQRIIIASHLGNPRGVDPALSTRHLIPWFEQRGFKLSFADSLKSIEEATPKALPELILFENLRFFDGEKGKSLAFAQQLAGLADIYINDAFGTMHRDDASISLLPTLFPPLYRALGLCVQQEIAALDTLKNNPQQPFTLVIGGSKVTDKIPLLERFFSQPPHQRPRICLIGGLIGLACLQVIGKATSSTLFDMATLNQAQKLLQTAQKNGVRLELPSDFATLPTGITLGAQPDITKLHQFSDKLQCVDIGPATVQSFIAALNTARTVFMNGTMGIYEYEPYQTGTKALLTAIAAPGITSIIGGGDCAAAAYAYGLEKNINFISTGGGATLAYLAAQDPLIELPGLKVLVC